MDITTITTKVVTGDNPEERVRVRGAPTRKRGKD